jgi:hypothetical protein
MRKISLLMLFALAFLFNAKATEIWTGSHAVTWGSALNLDATTFADAQPGNALKVFYTNASDGIELKANGVNIAGSRKNAWINGEGAYDLYLTPGAVDAIKAHGLEIVGANFTVTKVELNEVEDREGMTTMWRGLYWADGWGEMLFYPAIASVVDWSDYSAIRVYHEARRSDFVLNFKKSWADADHIGGIGDMTAGDGYVELPLTDERRALLASIDNELIVQFYRGDGKDPFNVTEIALVEKPYLWKGNQHVDYGERSVIALDKALFATATAGQKLIVKYATDTEKEIELKVMNEHFDHLAGSREQAKLNGNGRFEHFLTPKAVEELKAYGLEIGGNGFNALRVELVDGKASLPEGINVWTGYFWADNWNTMYLYWNGYRYVDFNDVKTIRFYSEAKRSDFVLNVRDNWDGDGGVEIANINAMTAGDGYMELPLTNYMREKIAASEHLLVQFNKESGDPFNVTDIVLVMEEPYTRTVTNGNYGTICLSRAAATIEGATMYRIVGGNASEGITIEEVASMEAGKPYIFQASADQITVTMTGPRAGVQDANGLIGNLGTDAITVPMDAFVLKNNLLYLVNSDVTIAPNRAYINMSAITSIAPTPGRIRRVIAVENQATGVESLQPSAFSLEKVLMNGQLFILRDGQLYNVTGVRVQ